MCKKWLNSIFFKIIRGKGGNKITKDWSSATWYAKERSKRPLYIIGTVVAFVAVISVAYLYPSPRPPSPENENFAPSPVTLNPIADTFVQNSQQGLNYGSGNSLSVIYDKVWRWGYSYLMFDLSTIPSTALIEEAKLELFAFNIAGVTPHIGAYYSSNISWNEMEMTWYNKPSFSATPTDVIPVVGQLFENKWFSWDITSDVQSAISERKLTVALKAQIDTVGFCTIIFRSKDSSEEWYPRLTVNYSD